MELIQVDVLVIRTSMSTHEVKRQCIGDLLRVSVEIKLIAEIWVSVSTVYNVKNRKEDMGGIKGKRGSEAWIKSGMLHFLNLKAKISKEPTTSIENCPWTWKFIHWPLELLHTLIYSCCHNEDSETPLGRCNKSQMTWKAKIVLRYLKCHGQIVTIFWWNFFYLWFCFKRS